MPNAEEKWHGRLTRPPYHTIGSGHFHTWGSGQSNMDIGMLSTDSLSEIVLTKSKT